MAASSVRPETFTPPQKMSSKTGTKKNKRFETKEKMKPVTELLPKVCGEIPADPCEREDSSTGLV
jgi:hypothetical protein